MLTLFAAIVTLSNSFGSVRVDTLGARVLSYRAKGDEVLWQPAAQQDPKAWTDGGIPICWPLYGHFPQGLHGFAWKSEFTVLDKSESPARSTLVLGLKTENAELEYTVVLEDELRLEMVTRNVSKKSLTFSAAFHPYFLVAERDKCRVSGAAPEPFAVDHAINTGFAAPKGSFACYRLADPVKNRTILVKADNAPRVNVWNPGEAYPSFREFVAVEPCISQRAPVTVAPGGWHVMKMGVEVRRGSNLTGFAWEDSRWPGREDALFAAPFKVLFIGAHPDDGEYDFGPAAAKLIRAGAKVTFAAVCNGDNGHQTMKPEALAARRYLETQASAKVYGLSRYIVMGEHDCLVEPTVDLRQRVTRLIRDIAPNMVIAHRTCDYHADHRAAGQVVQDSTYLIGVPLFAPESPVPEVLPFVVYANDRFTVPRPMRPDLIVDGEDEADIVADSLAAHESQVLEWLPPEIGLDPASVPKDPKARHAFIIEKCLADCQLLTCPQAPVIRKVLGREKFQLVNFFEICDYSRPPSARERVYLAGLKGFHWTDGR